MKQKIGYVALVVSDYDEAISFYCDKMGFVLVEDTDLGNEKRWVLVKPRNAETSLLLAKATNSEQLNCIGNQTGGRVGFFLHTDDFWSDYKTLNNNGVKITDEPREESYGTVVVFQDLYGNKWDLIALKPGV